MRLILILCLLSGLFLASCNDQSCTEEAKICPDGSAVGRNASINCEFNPCPEPTIPLKAVYDTKIVYTTESLENTTIYENDCKKRRGTLNKCGSPCPPGSQFCIQVCALTCELSGGKYK